MKEKMNRDGERGKDQTRRKEYLKDKVRVRFCGVEKQLRKKD